jgi:hypothetical protein
MMIFRIFSCGKEKVFYCEGFEMMKKRILRGMRFNKDFYNL